MMIIMNLMRLMSSERETLMAFEKLEEPINTMRVKREITFKASKNFRGAQRNISETITYEPLSCAHQKTPGDKHWSLVQPPAYYDETR